MGRSRLIGHPARMALQNLGMGIGTEKREKKAMENVKNAELNVKEMEQNMLKIQNKLKTMQEKKHYSKEDFL